MCVETLNTYTRCSATYSHVLICLAYVETFADAAAAPSSSSSWTAINASDVTGISRIHTSCSHYQQVTRKLAGGCCSCLVDSRECFQDELHFSKIFSFQERITWDDPNVKEAGREYYEWRQAVGWVSGEGEGWQNSTAIVPVSELLEREIRGIILEKEKSAWEAHIGPEKAQKKARDAAKIEEKLQTKKAKKQAKKEEKLKRKQRDEENLDEHTRSKVKLEVPVVIDLTQDDSDGVTDEKGRGKEKITDISPRIRTAEYYAALVDQTKKADLQGLGGKKHKKMVNRWKLLVDRAERKMVKHPSGTQDLNELIMEAREDLLRQAELDRQLYVMSLAK
ncbi:hypothetical protein B0J14DRAFT_666271 [Halenospora varia]|nr:hypothetical protein B0J14DRAFT_666271 [Halenospora varia]